MSWVSFHIKINEEFDGLEVGTLTKDIVKPNQGKWTYEDKKTELRVNEILYYWVNIVYNGVDYNLIDQEYRIKGLKKFSKNKKILY